MYSSYHYVLLHNPHADQGFIELQFSGSMDFAYAGTRLVKIPQSSISNACDPKVPLPITFHRYHVCFIFGAHCHSLITTRCFCDTIFIFIAEKNW